MIKSIGLLTVIFILLPVFADEYYPFPKEELDLIKSLKKELIDDNSRTRKIAYKKAETLSHHAMYYFIQQMEKKNHPELRYVAKLLRNKYFKSKPKSPKIKKPIPRVFRLPQKINNPGPMNDE